MKTEKPIWKNEIKSRVYCMCQIGAKVYRASTSLHGIYVRVIRAKEQGSSEHFKRSLFLLIPF